MFELNFINKDKVGALPTLETENRVQLYPYGNIGTPIRSKQFKNLSLDPVVELKKLNHSLVASFLELLDTLDSNPSQYQEKIDDIEVHDSHNASCKMLNNATIAVIHEYAPPHKHLPTTRSKGDFDFVCGIANC